MRISGCATILRHRHVPHLRGLPLGGPPDRGLRQGKGPRLSRGELCSGESFEILCQSGTACETVAKIIQSQLIELGHRGDGHGGGQLKLHPAAAGGRLRRRHPRAAQLHGGRRRGLDLLQHHPRATPTRKTASTPARMRSSPSSCRAARPRARSGEPYYAEALQHHNRGGIPRPAVQRLIAVAYSTHLQGVEAHCLGTYNFYRWSWD